MNLSNHEIYFSDSRMLHYKRSTKTEQQAIDLYRYNIILSQALYPLISILEVALRNSLDKAIRQQNGGNWIIEGQTGFMTQIVYYDKNAKAKKYDSLLLDKVAKVVARFNREGIPVMHNKVIADIGFSFWVKLLDDKPISTLKGAPVKAFRNYSGKNAILHGTFLDILRIRNRIAHHEPICFNHKKELCLETMRMNHRKILDALHWLDSDVRIWANSFDNVPKIIADIAQNVVKEINATPVRYSNAFIARKK